MTDHAHDSLHRPVPADGGGPIEGWGSSNAAEPDGQFDAGVRHDEEALARTAEVFKALSTVSRLRLLTQLAEGPSGVTDLSIDTGLAQPLVSSHLKVLRELRLVKVERIGRTARYSLNDDHVAHVIADALAHSKEPGQGDS